MIKNNLKAFLIHITISIISVFVFIIFNSGQLKWVSEEAAKRHHYSMMIVAFIVIAIACILYYLIARLLTNQGNIYRNLSGTSLTAILGIFFWIAAFNINLQGPGGNLLNSELWQFYSIYNGYSLFFLNELGSNNPYLFLLFAFVPAIAMAIGVQQKRN